MTTPRRELVHEYHLKLKANEEKLAAERQAVLDAAAAQAEAERQRKLEFKRDIVAQMEERKHFRETQRHEERSPARCGLMQSTTDDVTNKQLARQKAREALMESELKLRERRERKEKERANERDAEALLHRKLQEERQQELEKERLKKLELAKTIEKQKKAAESSVRDRSKERLTKLQQERKMADEMARLAQQQQYEDQERARQEKKIIAQVNCEVAQSSGRMNVAEKSSERQMRQELEEAEKRRKRQEQEDKLQAKLRLKQELESESQRRDEFNRTHASSISSPRNNNAAKALEEVSTLKQEQLNRQMEYRRALEQQIQERERRKVEQLISS